jgi:cyclopropane-fatty-acyl-phospholipid synthase
MTTSGKQVYEKLAKAGIHGPSSDECALFERHLTRYFEREYQRYIDNPVSLEDLGISTDKGPMSQETSALMKNHYDEKLEFFKSFLDKRYLAYTMAYYGKTQESIQISKTSLEDAQHAKFSLIVKRAQINGNERILNIGCGFAPLETYLLQEFPDIEIVSITPSKVQAAYIRERMQQVSDPLCNRNFKLIEGAFDQIPIESLGNSRYDIVITIGLFEHVVNMRFVLKRIAELLAPGGLTFHHFITSKIIIPQFLDPTKTLIGKYFPGGHAWPTEELIRFTENLNLVNKWFVNGLNYWRTLDEWHRRYWANIPSLYGSVFDTKAIAHWNNYFSLCKAMFAPMNGDFYGNSHYLFKLRS